MQANQVAQASSSHYTKKALTSTQFGLSTVRNSVCAKFDSDLNRQQNLVQQHSLSSIVALQGCLKL